MCLFFVAQRQNSPIAYRAYSGPSIKDSIESFEEYLERTKSDFDRLNPGPLYPLSEYGNTCWVRTTCALSFSIAHTPQLLGCEELHVECADKTHSIVTHCDCDPNNPKLSHRHVYKFSDLLEPPPRSRLGLDPGYTTSTMQTFSQFLYASSERTGKGTSTSSTQESQPVTTPTTASDSSSSYDIQLRQVGRTKKQESCPTRKANGPAAQGT